MFLMAIVYTKWVKFQVNIIVILQKIEYEKCKNDCIVFTGIDCINEMLDHVLEFKGDSRKNKNWFVEHDLFLITHSASGFENYAVLKTWLSVKLLLIW